MKRHRKALVAVAAGVATSLFGAGIVRHQAVASWERMAATASRNADERAARDARRPALWGGTRSGAAMTHYRRAIALAAELHDGDADAMRAMVRRSDRELAADAGDLRARWQPVLAELRLGAHCDDGRLPEPDRDEPYHTVNLLTVRAVVNAAIFEARALRHAGRHREAVEWSLDAATLGADFAQRGLLIHQMIGAALLSIATHEAWTDAALRELDPAALALLGEGLARLDAYVPERIHCGDELAYLAHHLRRGKQRFWSGLTCEAWAYGFSTRWMAADAFNRVAQVSARIDAQELAWPQRKQAMQRELEACQSALNPLLATMSVNYPAAEQTVRQTLAKLRMLRLAVALHRGQANAIMADPLASGDLAIDVLDDGFAIHGAARRNDAPIVREVRPAALADREK